MLSKAASDTTFWIFGMTRSGIETRSPRLLANTLLMTSNGWYAIKPNQTKPNHQIARWGSLIPLQRNSRCILQLQSTGRSLTCVKLYEQTRKTQTHHLAEINEKLSNWFHPVTRVVHVEWRIKCLWIGSIYKKSAHQVAQRALSLSL